MELPHVCFERLRFSPEEIAISTLLLFLGVAEVLEMRRLTIHLIGSWRHLPASFDAM